MDYEAMLENVYSNILSPGDCVIDIGAHSGRHCKPMASLVGVTGRVYAFEPNPVARQWLIDNVCDTIENKTVVVMPYAISNVTQKMNFIIANDRPEESGLKERTYNGPTTTQEIEVDVVTLDSALKEMKEAPTFIKIDVEGAEFDALKGANQIIYKFKPIIAFEFGQASYEGYGVDPGEVYTYFETLGYRLYSILGAPLEKAAFIKASKVQSFWDYLACPVEKSAELEKIFSLLNPTSANSSWLLLVIKKFFKKITG